jgi:hypothetical protein
MFFSFPEKESEFQLITVMASADKNSPLKRMMALEKRK